MAKTEDWKTEVKGGGKNPVHEADSHAGKELERAPANCRGTPLSYRIEEKNSG